MLIDDLLERIICDNLVMSPEVDVAEWAGENVWLSSKETPKPGFYDVNLTPWNKRVMDCANDPEVSECVVMKSSRSGVTEACLNVFRYKPLHNPGPCLYMINSDPKAKKVMDRRIVDHIKRLAPDKLTGSDDDVTRELLKLKNMDITVSGSGSPGNLMEEWFDTIILDELEEHDDGHSETTYDRAKGRMVGVDNPILYAISKPQYDGGPIHAEYLRGTQEKLNVPCPRCGEIQELIWDFVRFGHCKDLVGYNLEAVEEDTFYQCRFCGGRIDDSEKYEMNLNGVFVPEPEEKRNGFKAEPGVVSLHISDLYALHSQVKWGKLAAMFLESFTINPSYKKKKFFWTNHLGLPWEKKKASIKRGDLDMLRGGITEELADGKRVVVGKAFRWCYKNEVEVCTLPIIPVCITMTVDKQGECVKLTVFGWTKDGQAFPLEYAVFYSEVDALRVLKDRVYHDADGGEYKINYAMMDAGYKPKNVFRACLKSGGKMMPSKGQGASDLFKGKSIKLRTDYIDGRSINIVDYYNHATETDFYLSKVKDREDPRLWLPTDYGDEWGDELCSSFLVVKNGREKWDKKKDVPNDYGDTCKMQYALLELLKLQMPGLFE